jgi:hypothetical protein
MTNPFSGHGYDLLAPHAVPPWCILVSYTRNYSRNYKNTKRRASMFCVDQYLSSVVKSYEAVLNWILFSVPIPVLWYLVFIAVPHVGITVPPLSIWCDNSSAIFLTSLAICPGQIVWSSPLSPLLFFLNSFHLVFHFAWVWIKQ